MTFRPALPVIGDPGGARHDVLAVVLRHERAVPEGRGTWRAWLNRRLRRDRPIRGLLLAVDDLEEDQRPFLRWPGTLRRLDDATWAWHEGR